MSTKSFLLLYLCVAVTAFQAQSQPRPSKVQPYATLQNDLIQLHPSGFQFKVPLSWVSWNKSNHNNFHLTRPQIDLTKLAEGEWDKPYSHILLSLFPIEQCAVHVGGEGWGRASVAFSDVQMRAYVGSWSPAQIESLVRTKGVASASKFAEKDTTAFHTKRVGKWQVSQLDYRLWYGDYGGTARIDIYARAFGKQTVALAFMYADPSNEREIASIVNSFKAPA